MIPTLKSHIEFCRAVANGSTYKDAYKTYVATKNSLSEKVYEVEGSKMAKKYALHIQDLKKITSAAIDKAHENDAVNEALKGVMSKLERMQLLSDMAYGNVIVRKTIPIGGEDIQQECEPTHMDRIKAVAELNKMDGAYTPIKLADTDSEGNDKLQQNEIKEIVKLLNDKG